MDLYGVVSYRAAIAYQAERQVISVPGIRENLRFARSELDYWIGRPR
jgi:hypothetical protein